MLRRWSVLAALLASAVWVPGGAALAAPASPSQLLPRATTPAAPPVPVLPTTAAAPSVPAQPTGTVGGIRASARSTTVATGDAGVWVAGGGTVVLVAAAAAVLLRRRRVEVAVPRGGRPATAPAAGGPVRARGPGREVRRPAGTPAAATSTAPGRAGAGVAVAARPQPGWAEPGPEETVDGAAPRVALPPAGPSAPEAGPAGLTAVQRAARGLPLRAGPTSPAPPPAAEPPSATPPATPPATPSAAAPPPAPRAADPPRAVVRPAPTRPLSKRKGRR